MKPYIINIDKLQIVIKNNTHLNTEFKNNYSIKLERKTKYSKDFKESYVILYRNNPICYLYHINYLHKEQSKLYFYNDLLYQKDYSTIISNLLTQLNISEFNISKLEIAINTNENLLDKFYTKLLSNKIIFKAQSKYKYKSFSFIPSEQRFTDYILSDTIYIRKDSKDYKDNYIRIENKTNEIKANTKKDKRYILNSYRNKLDTNKDIFRMELCLDFTQLTNRSRNTRYKPLTYLDEPLTAYKYKNILSDNNYKESDFKAITVQKNYDIDIKQLEIESYLISLFNYFTAFNYTIIFKVNKTKDINFSNIEKPKNIDNIYSKEFNNDYDIFNNLY